MRRFLSATPALALFLLAPACMLSARAQDAPAPAVDPMTFMAPSTTVYFNVNTDAGGKFLDQMKDTVLGKSIQQAFQKFTANDQQADQGFKMFRMGLNMLQGFGSQIGWGITVPAEGLTGDTPPDMVIVLPVQDSAKVKAEIQLLTGMVAGNGGPGMKWRQEDEGGTTINVLERKKAKNEPDLAYALSPTALVIGTGGATVHTALRTAGHPEDSLAQSTLMKTLGAAVDRGQFLWGVVGKSNIMGMKAPKNSPVAFDISKLKSLKKMLDSQQGSTFTMGLYPDRIDVQSVSGYDPNSEFGQKFRQWRGTPMKAPALGYNHAVALFDISDLEHLTFFYTDLVKPMMTEMMDAMGGAKGGDQGAKMAMDMAFTTMDDFVAGLSGEMAVVVGSLENVNAKNPIPPVSLMFQKSPDGKLEKSIQSIMEMIANISGERWYSTQIAGVNAKIFGGTKVPIRPVYATLGDFNVLALDRSSIISPLYLSKGVNPDHALAADPVFQNFQKTIGTDANSMMYLNIRSIAQALMAQMPAQFRPGAAGGRPIDRAMTQLAVQFANDLNIVGGATYPDAVGSRSRMVLSFDPNREAPAP